MKPAPRLVRSLRNGQITIPIEFRQALHLTEHTMFQITLEGDELRLCPVALANVELGSPWLAELYSLFAPARREAFAFTEDQVNADIDLALADLRNRQHVSRGS